VFSAFLHSHEPMPWQGFRVHVMADAVRQRCWASILATLLPSFFVQHSELPSTTG
jgi:hypothetical protein